MAIRRYRQVRVPGVAAAGAAAAARSRIVGRRSGVCLLVLLGALALPGAAAGAPDWRRGMQEQLEPHSLVDNPPGISLEQAANKVRRETGGRVLSASPSERGAGYEIRVLLDGKRVKSYFVDGQGRIRARD